MYTTIRSYAHFKRRDGSLDGLDDRGARLTDAYTRSCPSIPCAHELILDYLEGVEHDSAIGVEFGVRHGAIRARFTQKCHFGRDSFHDELNPSPYDSSKTYQNHVTRIWALGAAEKMIPCSIFFETSTGLFSRCPQPKLILLTRRAATCIICRSLEEMEHGIIFSHSPAAP